MNRILNLAIALAFFLGACTGDEEAGGSTGDWRNIAPEQAPWTLEIPPGWSTSTLVVEPGPKAR